MKNPNWKKFVGVGLSVFVLSLGSVGLTGCETGEEVETEELEVEEEELEVEED